VATDGTGAWPRRRCRCTAIVCAPASTPGRAAPCGARRSRPPALLRPDEGSAGGAVTGPANRPPRRRHSGGRARRPTADVIVYLVDDRGKKVELLVNVIGTYHGVSGIGVKPGEYLLDIDAPSSWTATIEQPRPTSGRSPPQSYSGSRPDVAGPVTLDGLTRVVMKYKGNSNFIVYLMSAEGQAVELLANEIGSFSGSTALPGYGGIYWITVDAEGVGA
jgi:hypothetical protein